MTLTMLTYPRLSLPRATARIGQMLGEGAAAAPPPDDFSLREAASWPAVFEHPRADADDLAAIRVAVLELASRCGYPGRLEAQGRTAFDAELPRLLGKALRLTPAEAARRDMWSFLTLCVVPDVARWRYPRAETRDGTANLQYERYVGERRNILRQAWRRDYQLGPLVSVLDEDGFEALQGRRVFDDLHLARAFVEELDKQLRQGSAPQRLLTRNAAALIVRWAATMTFDYLSLGEKRAVCAEALRVTERVLAIDDSSRADVDELLASGPDALAEQGTLTAEELPEIRLRVDEYAAQFPSDQARAFRIREILWGFIDAWDELDADERAVASFATRYFLVRDDSYPDHAPDGLADDEDVAVRAKRLIDRRADHHPTWTPRLRVP